MNTVTFEITKAKTLVTIVGSANVEKVDITDTEIEQGFVKLLKQIKDCIDQSQILDGIDISGWNESKCICKENESCNLCAGVINGALRLYL